MTRNLVGQSPSLPWTKLYSDLYDTLSTSEKDRFRSILERQSKETHSQTQRIALALALEYIRAEEVMEYGKPI